MRARGFWVGLLLGAVWLGLPGTRADTIFFRDGTSIDCLVSEEKKKFTDEEYQDPNFIEIEVYGGYVGFWDRGQVERIEKNDKYVPPTDETEAFMRDLIQKNQLILPSAMVEGGLVLPTEVEKPMAGQVTQVKNWAFLSETGLEQKMRLQSGREFRAKQTLSTARNSRLKFAIGRPIAGGLGGGTTLQVQRLNHAEHLSMYELQFQLEQGQLWLEVTRSVLAGGVVEKVKIQLNDCDFVMEEGLLHCQVQRGQQLRLTLAQGTDINVRVKGNPVTTQLAPGQALLVPLEGEKRLSVVEADPAIVETWTTWDRWEPVEIAIPVEAVPGEPLSAPILGELSAFAEGRGRVESVLAAELLTDTLPTIMDKYRSALDRYKEQNGQYPNPAEGLQILHQAGSEGAQNDLYGVRGLPLEDPWGSPIAYDLVEVRIQDATDVLVSVRSLGPNRVDEQGLGDDIQ